MDEYAFVEAATTTEVFTGEFFTTIAFMFASSHSQSGKNRRAICFYVDVSFLLWVFACSLSSKIINSERLKGMKRKGKKTVISLITRKKKWFRNCILQRLILGIVFSGARKSSSRADRLLIKTEGISLRKWFSMNEEIVNSIKKPEEYLYSVTIAV